MVEWSRNEPRQTQVHIHIYTVNQVSACVLHTQQRLFPEKLNMTHIHITYLRTEQAGIWEVAQCKHIGKRHQQDNRYAHTHVDLQSLQHFWKFDMFICQSNVSIDPELN